MPIFPRLASAQFGIHPGGPPGSNSVPVVGPESEQAEKNLWGNDLGDRDLTNRILGVPVMVYPLVV